ncbi:MAG: hypothetical protein ACYC91_20005 [Solirubrobacteraceae bacterium]
MPAEGAERPSGARGAALRAGDLAAAAEAYRGSAERLAAAAPSAPAQIRVELEAETALLRDLADRASWDDPSRLLKFGESDRARKTRQRGRRESDEE